MEKIKVETDESMNQKVNINDLQSDVIIEQTVELRPKEELNCFDESFLTESNAEILQTIKGNPSSVEWERPNGEFPSKFKEEINDEYQFSGELCKEERGLVDIPDNKDILEHSKMIVWSDDEGSCEPSPVLGMRYDDQDDLRDINEQSFSKMEDNVTTKRNRQIIEQRSDRTKHVANCGSQLNVLDDNFKVTVESNCDVSNGEGLDFEDKSQVELQVDGKILECSFCHYVTVDNVDFRNHGIVMHNQFLCSSCTYSTPLEFCLKRHTSIEHSIVKSTRKQQKNYKSDKCSFAATNTGGLNKELIKKNNCELCDFSASSKGLVEIHRDAVHLKLKHFECHLCEFKTSRRSTLNAHADSVHLKRKIFGCHSCDFSTARSYVLKRHVDTVHLQVKNFKCAVCEYRTGSKYGLKLHAESVHSSYKGLEGYQCQLCIYKTDRKYELRVHQRAEHSERETFKCPTCQYRVLTKLDLEIHVNSVHLKQKKYKCDYCDFRTSRKKYMKPHVDSVHLNRKKYKCHFCIYKARSKQVLKSHHDSVHLRLKKFKCDLCEFRTCRKDTLNLHARHCLSEMKKRECFSVQ